MSLGVWLVGLWKYLLGCWLCARACVCPGWVYTGGCRDSCEQGMQANVAVSGDRVQICGQDVLLFRKTVAPKFQHLGQLRDLAQLGSSGAWSLSP